MSETIVLFSGGSDSTLAAALELERLQKVHLLTFDRISFIGASRYTNMNYQNLCRIYGANHLVRKIIKIDHLHSKVCYAEYFQLLKEFGSLVASLSFSKIAMHWAAAIYALENKITKVVDGSVPYMHLYPDQNKNIASQNLKRFYAQFGICYETPIFEISDQVEQMLYDRGLSMTANIRGSNQDFQVFYIEQVLLALFLKYYLTLHSLENYENKFSKLYQNRLQMITTRISA